MKEKIAKLRATMVRTVNEARSMLDNAADGKFNDEQKAKYDTMMNDVKETRTSIDRLEKMELLETELRTADGKVETAGGAAPAPANKDTEKELVAYRTYLKTGRLAPELRTLQADAPESGGYIVTPAQALTRLIKKLDDLLFVRQHATVIPVTESDSLGCPTIESDPSDADWTAEVGAVNSDTAMKFGGRDLKPHLLSKEVQVSMKLLRISALPVENLVMDRLAYKFALPQEKAFLTGTGNGQPLGLFTASAQGISTTRDIATHNTATVISFDNLKKVKFSVKQQYQKNCRWMIHRDILAAIALLKYADGKYIWDPETDMLLNKPVDMSEYCPSTMTANQYVGLYGDLSNYWIADGQNYSVQRLNELNARNNKVGFIGRQEVDGMPVLEEAFARIKMGA